MTRDAKFQRLLNSATKAAQRHALLSNEVSHEIKYRYGKEPGEVDADEIIDAVDYGQGSLTVAEVHEAMTLRGCVRIDEETQP